MRSGKPVLIVPHAHDQFDNAARVAKLGCARALPRPRYNAKNAMRELSLLLDDPSYANAAKRVGEVVSQEDGTHVATDEIEKALTRG
jgi:rhamnosyltransferase subunit B